MASAFENRWFVVKKSVVLTETIEPVIISLDKYFQKENKVGYVTSGLRYAADQLAIIRKYLVIKKLDKIFKETMTCQLGDKVQFGTKIVYKWQEAWSKLLNIGIIINPPYPAECLLDYINKAGVNRKGAIIPQSPHIRGTAFDCGGGVNGISDELPIFQKAFADKVKGMKGITIERANNCIHIDCENFLPS